MKHEEIGPAYAISALLPVGLTVGLDEIAAERGISRAAALRMAAQRLVADWQAQRSVNAHAGGADA